MEVDNDVRTIQCVKIPYNILGNLNITSDAIKSKIFMWSKYEVFSFNQIVRNIVKWDIPFQIEKVLVNGECLLCLDCSGIINLCTIETSSICNKQNIKCVCTFKIEKEQYVISLQFEQNKSKLLVNKFDIEFTPLFEIEIQIPNEDWKDPEKGKSIIVSYLIKPEHLKKLKDNFNLTKKNTNYVLVIISLDKINVYAIVIPIQNVNLSEQLSTNLWLKLYSSSTEIVDISIIMTDEIYILVALTAGNIIKIPLLLRKPKPEVCHLNTALNKLAIMGDTIIYTDGLTMWKCKNIFTEYDLIFEQFVVRNIRDFCIIAKQVYCLTYTNLLYSFNVDDRKAYLVLPDDADHTCAVPLVTNSDYLRDTLMMVQKNKELLEKINKESEYLMAVSLSNRQDIMDSFIQVNASVFDDYRDLAQKYTDLTLTDELNAYYDSNSFYFLIQISVAKVQHKLNRLLSQVLGDIKIHITLLEDHLIKTTSINVEEELTRKNLVIPLRRNKNIRRVQMHLKIITNIPGKFNEDERLWIILYRKCIVFHAENFINMKTSTNTALLKEDKMPLEMLISKMAYHLHGTKYVFDDQRVEWSFHIKLPSNDILNMDYILGLIKHLDQKKSDTFQKHKAKFSRGKNGLEFQIGKDMVRLNIDGDNLRVKCRDVITAIDIRNFFSSVIFTSFKGKPGTVYIDHKLYTTIEDLKRDIERFKTRGNNELATSEEFTQFFTHFLCNICCSIPI